MAKWSFLFTIIFHSLLTLSFGNYKVTYFRDNVNRKLLFSYLNL